MLTFHAWHKLGKKFALYYYEVSCGEDTLQFSPNCYVDISETEAQKRAACFAMPARPRSGIIHCKMPLPAFAASNAGSSGPRHFFCNYKVRTNVFSASAAGSPVRTDVIG